MSLRRAAPVAFAPKTVCDALDCTDGPDGAMASLANLIPDPTSKNLFQCRPAATLETAFVSFAGAGFVSCFKVLGSLVYGLIATSRNPGKDEPFCYNLVSDAFVTIGGTIDATTTPTSPASTGAWSPPTMDLVGTKLLVTHPGYNGTGGVYFGYFDVSDPSAPTWSAGNVSGGITFSTAPTWVKNFNGRAYWGINPPTGQPSAVYSDVLVPLVVTNSNQVLTFDDNLPLTACGALGANSQLTGTITQCIIVFKGVSGMYQVTGDASSTTSPLTRNALSVPTGTLAPNSITPTPKGLAFMSPDGMRIIGFDTSVSDPIGHSGLGITVPFTYAVTPTRVAAACGSNIMRISTQNGYASGTPDQEYWFDFARGIWTGPHSFPASLISAYQNSFIMTPLSSTNPSVVIAKLFMSDVVQNTTSTYTENGTALTWTWQTSQLPDTQLMCENAMIETTVYMSLLAGGAAVSCYAVNPNGVVFDTVSIQLTGSTTQWGQFQWGQALWQGAASALYPRQLQWTIPITFRRVGIGVTGASVQGYKIGRLHMRYEALGYLQQDQEVA